MYKATLRPDATVETRNKYVSYRNNYNHIKRPARLNYYKLQVEESKTNTKRLWQVINTVINKRKNKGSIIPYITVEGIRIYDSNKIADKFGKFYSTIGSNLAKKITTSSKCIDDYIRQIPRSVNSLAVHATTPAEIESIIRAMPNETSYGHDSISNVILKTICEVVSLPLCRIFNQSILEGRFPDAMQIAEVIPLYKNKEMDAIINYRPISLLITMSKVLEKIVYKRTYSYLEKNNILYNSQYGFRMNHNCKQAIIELTSKILHAKECGEQSVGFSLICQRLLIPLTIQCYYLNCNDWVYVV